MKNTKILYIIVIVVIILTIGFFFFDSSSKTKGLLTKSKPSYGDVSGDYDKLRTDVIMDDSASAASKGNYKVYSHYYDLLYQDKDYEGESKYIIKLLKKYKAKFGSALELGCGTGKHAKLLVDHGFKRVTGVDLSEGMIEEAKSHHVDYIKNNKLDFYKFDVRDVQLKKQPFDVVLSLFHVVSYQIKTEDVLREFKQAAKYVKSGGLFLFDVWYGPTVVSMKPETRVKHMESDKVKVMRIAKSELFPQENKVHVNYEVFITDKATGKMTYTKERHPMRFYFTPELKHYLKETGFEYIHSEQWMTGKEPGVNTWGVTFVARKL